MVSLCYRGQIHLFCNKASISKYQQNTASVLYAFEFVSMLRFNLKTLILGDSMLRPYLSITFDFVKKNTFFVINVNISRKAIRDVCFRNHSPKKQYKTKFMLSIYMLCMCKSND